MFICKFKLRYKLGFDGLLKVTEKLNTLLPKIINSLRMKIFLGVLQFDDTVQCNLEN